MKNLKIIQGLSKAGKILSKIVFVFSIVGAIFCILGSIVLIATKDVQLSNGSSLYSFIAEKADMSFSTIVASTITGAIFCAVEIFVAYKAVAFFKIELEKGTPFDRDISKRMRGLGITVLISSVAVSILSAIAVAIIEKTLGTVNDSSSNSLSFGVGFTFFVISYLLDYGADIRELNEQTDSAEDSSEKND